MITFLADALTLIRKAMAARDRGQDLVTRRTPASTAREALAGPAVLMTPDELNDPSTASEASAPCRTSTQPTAPPSRSASHSTR